MALVLGMGPEALLGKLPEQATVECQRRNQEKTQRTAGQQQGSHWLRMILCSQARREAIQQKVWSENA